MTANDVTDTLETIATAAADHSADVLEQLEDVVRNVDLPTVAAAVMSPTTAVAKALPKRQLIAAIAVVMVAIAGLRFFTSKRSSAAADS